MNTRVLAFILALALALPSVGCGKKAPEQSDALLKSTSQIAAAIDTASVPETDVIENTSLNTEMEIALYESADSSEETVLRKEITFESTEDAVEPTEETIDEEEARLIAEEEVSVKAEEERQKAEEEERKAEEERIRAEQLNSFSMMYYLAITAEEIRTAKDNRLILNDIYTTLLNDINPGAVDEITQMHLRSLRDIIKGFMNISVKRERLQYIYNQDKAAAMKSAIPNPIAVLSMANALDWKRLAVSAVYATVDSYNRYKNANDNADKAFLMSGWELDDEEKETILKNRDRAFDYMVDMVQEYHLDGLKTLNEKDVVKFAEICATESISERIGRLCSHSEKETYSLLGNYWLELADCYFQTNQYLKCLECVDRYNELATGIYRKDYNYVQILPKAIVAAQNTYTGSKYISVIRDFTDAIIKNTSTEDWSIRYFAAQVYLDLYARTKDQAFMESAYRIANENVTVLLKGQRELNDTYLADVQEVQAKEPDSRGLSDKEKKAAFKEEKKRVKEYNKALNDARVTELPSLYEPLVLNCELLFALADELKLNEAEKMEIEDKLRTNTYGIFITKPINDAFSFSKRDNKYSLSFNKDDIGIPAAILTAGSVVTVSVTDNGKTETFDDCEIQKVVRKGDSIDTFTAYYASKNLKKYEWTAASKVSVTIRYTDANDRTETFNYKVIDYQEHWYGDKVIFGEI